eukprot:gnl/Carplike_NY0171/3205_a4309_279.p1 GENE.gnl/Carplike_NY0171/3205_a4309_279~~gnl/Carplike_NY0171/3205_a4309_279.p1  ORF type:complete len:468 (-),score=143.74 gnl/Carplike_NY0171/3205_a4309_279:70-1401(-)
MSTDGDDTDYVDLCVEYCVSTSRRRADNEVRKQKKIWMKKKKEERRRALSNAKEYGSSLVKAQDTSASRDEAKQSSHHHRRSSVGDDGDSEGYHSNSYSEQGHSESESGSELKEGEIKRESKVTTIQDDLEEWQNEIEDEKEFNHREIFRAAFDDDIAETFRALFVVMGRRREGIKTSVISNSDRLDSRQKHIQSSHTLQVNVPLSASTATLSSLLALVLNPHELWGSALVTRSSKILSELPEVYDSVDLGVFSPFLSFILGEKVKELRRLQTVASLLRGREIDTELKLGYLKRGKIEMDKRTKCHACGDLVCNPKRKDGEEEEEVESTEESTTAFADSYSSQDSFDSYATGGIGEYSAAQAEQTRVSLQQQRELKKKKKVVTDCSVLPNLPHAHHPSCAEESMSNSKKIYGRGFKVLNVSSDYFRERGGLTDADESSSSFDF